LFISFQNNENEPKLQHHNKFFNKNITLKTKLFLFSVIIFLLQISLSYSQMNNDTNKVLIGSWVGVMGGKQLDIVIETVNGNQITGYDICGGNKRNLKGTFAEGMCAACAESCGKGYNATLNEPGDDAWDGVFTVFYMSYKDFKDGNHDLGCIGT
jgi:hypothetical protein